MKATRPTTAKSVSKKNLPVLFGRENYKWMLIGVSVMLIGFLLMAGGGSDDPSVFPAEEIYSFRRITLAPIVILAGFVIEIFAIFREPRKAG